ncbi:hypothetical protein RFI_25588 [Reticulomyxa filosa]|uniref:Uncharacterized protein n=1 Tax=Reticulomyxa filosa TaxID=46433 RepID=X6MD19_RETFI|nr:hypothetical protein RFI_25588 [Reticulomyxa filosa]|eukprot:ETO11789.1 hypothetical protein RFI_25588 [Reticulomyxa filosa]
MYYYIFSKNASSGEQVLRAIEYLAFDYCKKDSYCLNELQDLATSYFSKIANEKGESWNGNSSDNKYNNDNDNNNDNNNDNKNLFFTNKKIDPYNNFNSSFIISNNSSQFSSFNSSEIFPSFFKLWKKKLTPFLLLLNSGKAVIANNANDVHITKNATKLTLC